MTPKLDFAKITQRDALDIAIIIEDEAHDRYVELAEQLEQHRTSDAAAFFKMMAANESKHGDELRAERQKSFGDKPVEIDRTLVPTVETTDYDEARAFMSPHRALRIALANEERAYAFYAGAVKKVKDERVRALFAELQKEEKEHQDMVKRAIAKLPPEDRTNPDDFVDEPVAQ